MRISRSMAGILVSVIAVAGCGSSKDAESTETAAPQASVEAASVNPACPQVLSVYEEYKTLNPDTSTMKRYAAALGALPEMTFTSTAGNALEMNQLVSSLRVGPVFYAVALRAADADRAVATDFDGAFEDIIKWNADFKTLVGYCGG